MKNINKRIIAMIFLMVGCNFIYAQVQSEYNRSTITFVMIEDNGNEYNADIKKQFLESRDLLPDKFTNHKIDNPFVTSKIPDTKITKQIVEKWYNRKNDGSFDMEIIKDRIGYNTTDANVMVSKSSIRGYGFLDETAKTLIQNSYILVYSFDEIENMNEYYNRMDNLISERNRAVDTYNSQVDEYNRKRKSNQVPLEYRSKENYMLRDKEGYTGKVNISIYQLNWNDSIESIFYSDMYYELKDATTSIDKISKFNRFDFPIKAVNEVPKGIRKQIYSNQFIDPQKNVSLGNRHLTSSELFDGLVILSVYEGIEMLKIMKSFQVKTSIFSTNPIFSKIGLKEGVSVDQRYFVYENTQNSKGVIKLKRRGVVRATSKIDDNRQNSTGKTVGSKFYQVAGSKLDKGMLLQEKYDAGMGLSLNYGKNGLNVLFEFNIGRFMSVPGVKTFGDVTFGSITYDTYRQELSNKINVSEQVLDGKGFDPSLSTSNITYSLGISKDFNFGRNFVLIPLVSYGGERISLSTDSKIIFDDNYLNGPAKYTYNSNSLKDSTIITYSNINIGTRFGINLRHNIQLLATVYYRYRLNGKLNEEIFHTGNYLPNDVTDKSIKMFSNLGLRIQF